MPYPVSSRIAVSGLFAQQNNLDTIAKNIANKDVEGYKRLNPSFKTMPNNSGVEYSASANNYPWIDKNLSEKNAELSRVISVKDAVSEVDNLVMNNNVEETYSNFLNASKNLQSFPESQQHLQEFNSVGRALNDSIEQTRNAFNQIQRRTQNRIDLGKIELDSLKNQLSEISSKGINETNSNDVQLLQQRIASLTGSVAGYNEFINNIIPPLTYKFEGITKKLKDDINSMGGDAMFGAGGNWRDQTGVNNLAINNSESIIDFRDTFGAFKTEVGALSNKSLLDTRFATNQQSQAVGEYDRAYEVNLESEIVNMMNAQRMYEANARVLKVGDNMIGSLLNAIG
jgi:flagellar hook-associated protein FlgK